MHWTSHPARAPRPGLAGLCLGLCPPPRLPKAFTRRACNLLTPRLAGHTWSHLLTRGHTWSRTWSHLVTPGHTRSFLVTLGRTWSHLVTRLVTLTRSGSGPPHVGVSFPAASCYRAISHWKPISRSLCIHASSRATQGVEVGGVWGAAPMMGVPSSCTAGASRGWGWSLQQQGPAAYR